MIRSWPGVALAAVAALTVPFGAAQSVEGAGCATVVSITASATELLSLHATEAAARDAAIRRALADAAMRGGGVEIANSFRLVQQTTIDQVAFATDQRTLMRSRARLIGWALEREAFETNETGQRFAAVTIKADVCQDSATQLPLIVAFGEFPLDPRIDTTTYRERMMDLFPAGDAYEVTLGLPSTAYYDITISGQILAIDAVVFDRTREIEALRQFLGNAAVAGLAPQVQRLRVVVQTSAETILGAAMVEVQERGRDIAVGADPTVARREIADEAFAAAASGLFARMAAQAQAPTQ